MNIEISVERDPDWPTDVDNRINYGINVGKNRGFIHKNDILVVVTGWRQGFELFLLFAIICFMIE